MTAAAGTRPSAGFLFSHPAHFIALGFGTGLSPLAPGTVGTLLAFPLYAVLEQWLPSGLFAATLAGLFAAGIWACDRCGRDLGVIDHGAMNFDETVAFLLVLLFAPQGLVWQAAAFAAFRFFDIVKPPPIRHVERTVKNGLGVMLDDLIAAFYTLLLVAAAKRLLG